MDILDYMMCIIVPVIFVIIGIVFNLHPAKEINDYIGFRSEHAKMNQENWDFAQKFGAKIFLFTNSISLVVSVVAAIFLYKNSIKEDMLWLISSLLILIQCIPFIITVFAIENALKNKINKDREQLN